MILSLQGRNKTRSRELHNGQIIGLSQWDTGEEEGEETLTNLNSGGKSASKSLNNSSTKVCGVEGVDKNIPIEKKTFFSFTLLQLKIMHWLRGLDLNQGPSGYEPDELPDCSTPR